jgi:hypothetical protein
MSERTIDVEFVTDYGIFDLEVTLKGGVDQKYNFIDPDVKAIKCKGDITDLLLAAGAAAVTHHVGKYPAFGYLVDEIKERAMDEDKEA